MTPSRARAPRPRIAFGLASASLAVLAGAAAVLLPSWPVGAAAAAASTGLSIAAVVRAERLVPPLIVLGITGLVGWTVAASTAIDTVGRLEAQALQSANSATTPSAPITADPNDDELTRSAGTLVSGKRVVLRVESDSEHGGVETRQTVDGDGVWVFAPERLPYAESRPLDLSGPGRDELAIAARPYGATARTTVRCSISVDGKVIVQQEARGLHAAVLCTAAN